MGIGLAVDQRRKHHFIVGHFKVWAETDAVVSDIPATAKETLAGQQTPLALRLV